VILSGSRKDVIVGNAGWQQVLEANTVAFTDDFVYRPEFLANYPETLSAAAYVDKLQVQAGKVLTFDEYFKLANGLMAGPGDARQRAAQDCREPEIQRRGI
jgi:hypothetical protein